MKGTRTFPEWFLKIREEAERFYRESETPRNKYINLSIIHPEEFDPEAFTQTDIPDRIRQEDTSGYAVFVDNRLVKWKSLAEGLDIYPLEEALEHPVFREHFSKAVEPGRDKFTAYHYAVMESGIFIYVEPDARIEKPFHLIFIHASDRASMHPHILIVADRFSRFAYLEEAFSINENITGFYNPVVEIFALDESRIYFSSIFHMNERVLSYGRRRGVIGRNAIIDINHGWLGGNVNTNHTELLMDAPGAEGEDTQIFFGRDEQTHFLTTRLLHRIGDSKGNVMVRGALKDRAHSIFDGLIRIYHGAQRSNAFLEEHTIILNPGARSDAIPGLEIEANDVRCTHSATVGELEEERIFYLQSRGIPYDEARKMLVLGFFEFAIEKVPIEEAKKRLISLIEEKWN